MTSTPVWLYSPAQKEEGRRKYDEHGMRARPSGGGGGRDTVFNHGVNLQLRFLERLGDMMTVARSENLRIPLAEDGREICICFLSKGECIRSYTRSHAHVRGYNRDSVIQYIRVARKVMDLSWKIKFNGGGDWGSHGGHWDGSGGNSPRNSEGQNHGNGVGIGGEQGGHSCGIDGNNVEGGGVKVINRRWSNN